MVLEIAALLKVLLEKSNILWHIVLATKHFNGFTLTLDNAKRHI